MLDTFDTDNSRIFFLFGFIIFGFVFEISTKDDICENYFVINKNFYLSKYNERSKVRNPRI